MIHLPETNLLKTSAPDANQESIGPDTEKNVADEPTRSDLQLEPALQGIENAENYLRQLRTRIYRVRHHDTLYHLSIVPSLVGPSYVLVIY